MRKHLLLIDMAVMCVAEKFSIRFREAGYQGRQEIFMKFDSIFYYLDNLVVYLSPGALPFTFIPFLLEEFLKVDQTSG